MKQRFGKLFVLIPIGIFLISFAMMAMKVMKLPDSLTGMIFGIGIGLELLPFILSRKVKGANEH
ncbi:hypothetical protein HDE69_000379 [Pedobacter cryoconitis]|uniref:Uncharacterized protein n=1 Tax=Pedobacter cryoconitis TaxID=188932 RepID=A0A7W9DHP7_9SPHI|nr:hypothetical protein [Pedobacter cryoconitis]MBB5619343.1 hypothetical protein [Pedobacter cryoconitis]